jgi:hypothetical protein
LREINKAQILKKRLAQGADLNRHRYLALTTALRARALVLFESEPMLGCLFDAFSMQTRLRNLRKA